MRRPGLGGCRVGLRSIRNARRGFSRAPAGRSRDAPARPGVAGAGVKVKEGMYYHLFHRIVQFNKNIIG